MGAFQHALAPLHRAAPLLAQLGPVAGERTHVALRLRRDDTRVQPAAAYALGSPAGSGLVGCPPGDVLARCRLHQPHGPAVFPQGWVVKYCPLLEEAFRRRQCPVGRS